MSSKEYNIRDKIPVRKALVYENLEDDDFVIDIGYREVKKKKGIEIISNTIIRIPKSINKDEYWQKINRVKDFQRIKSILYQHKVSPIFGIKEYSFLDKKIISRLSEKDINYLEEILN